ncbi:hypothetical protein CC1G_03098 [Coprinopsis cinerea okayama7|uniref:G domain-containing protein n=1 Tax=Coprinopsis cinerea (strain Okayama-7 / 130 / ATCC MYA-4618 / FGSC 9003) TaxID=240176 RepID=A8PEX7_COPC7|nr:hypothetical protein CC1G_03098 [Coprinopsis cinerea okayama7\|eukprot:XP_001840869.1 hypothetical protein CC1G_03098 [Coprinopsis cinerea okayama7\
MGCIPSKSASSPPSTAAKPKTVYTPKRPTSSVVPNIVVFGETGAGKSSLINMLAGREVTEASNSATGVTPSNLEFSLTIGNQEYRIWDTAGLNEADTGTVPAQKALDNLQVLLKTLAESSSGVSLLIYCIGGMGYGEILRINFDLVWGIMCQARVPILILITNQEYSKPEGDSLIGDTWWKAHSSRLLPDGTTIAPKHLQHVPVVTIRGGDNKWDSKYEHSCIEVKKRIQQMVNNSKWNPPKSTWRQVQKQLAAYYKHRKVSRDKLERKIVVTNYQTAFATSVE